VATYARSIRRGLPRTPGGESWPPSGEAPGTNGDGAGTEVLVGTLVKAAPRHDAGTDTSAPPDAAGPPEVAGPESGVPEATDPAPADREAVSATPGGRMLRRGLPRVPGGEPWPPADAAAETTAGETAGSQAAGASVGAATGAAVAAAGAAETVAAGSTRAGSTGAGSAEVSPSREAAEEVAVAAGPSATSVETPAVAEGGALRRGLPRVAGGEPWPPASSVRSSRSTAAPSVPAVAAATAAPDVTASDSSAPPSAPAEAAPPTAAGRPIRTGLPRTTAATAAPAAPSSPAEAAQAAAPTAPRATPATSAAQPAAPAAQPAAPQAAQPAPAVPQAPAAAAVALAERPPLPFTRTVWPGTAARSQPAPRPEPKRYGPFTRGQWAGSVIVAGAGLLFAAAMAVLATRWFLSLDFMQDFLAAYPGEYPLPEGAPVGIPPWLGWQHFFNTFLIVLIIRSGLQVRTEKRPSVFWSPRNNNRRKISLNLWFHQSLDILWIVNGVIFVVLLFVTGQWMKIVPTSWAVFPNAVSAALQYVSLDWPTENGWVNYNSLQQLAYFATVFLAAPLAILTGVRMSGIWPKNAKRLSAAYPVEWARAVHVPVMLYFVLFIVVHVTLVFATGALRNLNHMYASQDAVNWAGFWIFVASLVVIAVGWVAARPLVLAPIARLFGKVSGR
jgi:thiosulfate reductase cytochrome b subunit